MGKIMVEGNLYKVTDKGYYNHDMGSYCKRVQTPDGERVVVGSRGYWRFWGPRDRVQPMLDAVAQGWTVEGGWPKASRPDEEPEGR